MKIPVELFDNRKQEFVDAELFDDITPEDFEEIEAQWRPLVQEAKRKLIEMGKPDMVPQHAHWDWTRKAPELEMLAIRFFGIQCKQRLQGIVKLQTVGYESRILGHRGKPLVYIDYVEVAPWNVRMLTEPLGKKTEFRAVGTRLMEVAIRVSIDEDFKGRVGLHSLPRSEGYYINECGMTAVDRDPSKQNLLWCEFTPDQAKAFLPGESK